MTNEEEFIIQWQKELDAIKTLLEGKTIIKVEREAPKKKEYTDGIYDDDPAIVLTLNDGKKVKIDASYGGYTGNSEGEY